MRIIYTSDLHGFLYPTDFRNREFKAAGLAHLAEGWFSDLSGTCWSDGNVSGRDRSGRNRLDGGRSDANGSVGDGPTGDGPGGDESTGDELDGDGPCGYEAGGSRSNRGTAARSKSERTTAGTSNLLYPSKSLNTLSRRRNPNTLILDGGDTIQGSPLAYYCRVHDQPELLGRMMRRFDYDFITLGNHDFNYGWEFLQRYLSSCGAVCVCENVLIDGKVAFPWQQIYLDDKIIGIGGLVTDFVNVWERPANLGPCEIESTWETAQKLAQEMNSVCDFSLLLYHGGFEEDLATGKILENSGENIGARLARELEFDLILAAHQHVLMPGQKLYNSYIVQNAAYAESYQDIEVLWDNRAATCTSRALYQSEAHKLSGVGLYQTETHKFSGAKNQKSASFICSPGNYQTELQTNNQTNCRANIQQNSQECSQAGPYTDCQGIGQTNCRTNVDNFVIHSCPVLNSQIPWSIALRESYAEAYENELAPVQDFLDQVIGLLPHEIKTGNRIAQALVGSPLADLINQAQLEASGAQISCTGLANGHPFLPRQVRIRDLLLAYPYNNQLVTLEIQGRDLWQALEKSTSYLEARPDKSKCQSGNSGQGVQSGNAGQGVQEGNAGQGDQANAVSALKSASGLGTKSRSKSGLGLGAKSRSKSGSGVDAEPKTEPEPKAKPKPKAKLAAEIAEAAKLAESAVELAKAEIDAESEPKAKAESTAELAEAAAKLAGAAAELAEAAAQLEADTFFEENTGLCYQVAEAFLKPKEAHYLYDFYKGLSFKADYQQPPGHRILSVRIAGQAIDLNKHYILALSDYRAGGFGGYEMFRHGEVLATSDQTILEILVSFIHRHYGTSDL